MKSIDNFDKSSLVLLIKHLDDDDIKALKSFLKSPFFATNKTIENFFLAIIKYQGNFKNKRFTAANCYNKVFPGRAFNQGTFNNLQVKLKSAIEDYFAHQEIKTNLDKKSEYTRKGYLKRNYKSRFIQKSEAQLQEYFSKRNKIAEDYLTIIQINQALYDHSNIVGMTPDEAHARMVSCMDALDQFYFTSKMMFSAELINQQKQYNTQYNIRFFEAIKNTGPEIFESSDDIFHLYLQLAKLREKPDKENYTNLKATFLGHQDSLSQMHQTMILTTLDNYAITKLSEGDISYQNELFHLYEIRDRLDLFLENKMFSAVIFCNVITTALACNEIEWTKNFIKRYRNILEESNQTDALIYAKALMAFHEKRYEQVLAILPTFINNRALNYDIRIRPLSIQTLYELSLLSETENHEETMELEIRAMRAFLTKRRINPNNLIRYKNFCSICLALVHRRKPKEQLLKLIARKKNLICKTWLLEKVHQLKH